MIRQECNGRPTDDDNFMVEKDHKMMDKLKIRVSSSTAVFLLCNPEIGCHIRELKLKRVSSPKETDDVSSFFGSEISAFCVGLKSFFLMRSLYSRKNSFIMCDGFSTIYQLKTENC